MRMSNELYGKLSDAIDNVLSKHSLETIKNHRANVKYVKNQFVAFCWSIYHASKFDCYKYDKTLHDAHIETALKRILSDFE